MPYYSTIQDLIRSVDDEEISYRNLHTQVNVRTKGETVKIPYKSIIRPYLPFLKKDIIYAHPNENDKNLYRYKPKKLSLDLYGTTELWSDLLELNNVISVINFTLEKNYIRVFRPKTIKKMINEILIMEEVLR